MKDEFNWRLVLYVYSDIDWYKPYLSSESSAANIQQSYRLGKHQSKGIGLGIGLEILVLCEISANETMMESTEYAKFSLQKSSK